MKLIIMKKKISILIPFYNEQEVLPVLFERLSAFIDDRPEYEWEILMIDDGSTDESLLMVKQWCDGDSRWHYVALSRNFGKEVAMMAGFDYVSGDCTIIMDADLQDPPEVIDEMIIYWQQGYQDVYGRRKTRGKEPWLRKQLSLLYYNILAKVTKIPVLKNTGDFRLLDKVCIEALKQLRESQRYTKGLFCYIGYKKYEVLFDRGDRAAGETKWNFFKLLSLAIEGITSYTTAPLRIATLAGFIISGGTFLYAMYFLIKTLIWDDTVRGFPTLIIVILFMGGINLLSLGQ